MPSYVVTGASRGLGYVWVTTLAKDSNNTVIALVRNKASTEARLAKDGIKNIHVVAGDITDLASLEQAAKDVTSITGGSLDILIHNAAFLGDGTTNGTVLELSSETIGKDLNTFMQANVVGTAWVINSFLPLIRKGQQKKIVIVSSGMADIDFINRFDVAVQPSYSISKAASNALIAKYNAALGKSEGILVFSMSPGLVDTSEGKTPTEEEIAFGTAMIKQFQPYAPGWQGPITPEVSVQHQIKVIDRASVEDFGGAFVSHYGDKQWL